MGKMIQSDKCRGTCRLLQMTVSIDTCTKLLLAKHQRIDSIYSVPGFPGFWKDLAPAPKSLFPNKRGSGTTP